MDRNLILFIFVIFFHYHLFAPGEAFLSKHEPRPRGDNSRPRKEQISLLKWVLINEGMKAKPTAAAKADRLAHCEKLCLNDLY